MILLLQAIVENNKLARSFLPPADRVDDTTGREFFHFGWEDVNGGWLIRRQTRSDSTFVDATEINNSDYTTLEEAWPHRLGLTYE